MESTKVTRTGKRYTTGTHDEIERLFRSGKSATEISQQLGINRHTINNILRSRGIHQRNWSGSKPIIKAEDIQGLVRAYQSGKKVSDLAIMYGCSRSTVREKLVNAGVFRESDTRAKPMSDKKKSDICRYYRLGWEISKIAETVGVKEGTVNSYISKQGLANRNAARKDPNWLPGAPLRLDGTPDIRQEKTSDKKDEKIIKVEEEPKMDRINNLKRLYKVTTETTLHGGFFVYRISGNEITLETQDRIEIGKAPIDIDGFISFARELSDIADILEGGEI